MYYPTFNPFLDDWSTRRLNYELSPEEPDEEIYIYIINNCLHVVTVYACVKLCSLMLMDLTQIC